VTIRSFSMIVQERIGQSVFKTYCEDIQVCSENLLGKTLTSPTGCN
jgi:hypothetical protein